MAGRQQANESGMRPILAVRLAVRQSVRGEQNLGGVLGRGWTTPNVMSQGAQRECKALSLYAGEITFRAPCLCQTLWDHPHECSPFYTKDMEPALWGAAQVRHHGQNGGRVRRTLRLDSQLSSPYLAQAIDCPRTPSAMS